MQVLIQTVKFSSIFRKYFHQFLYFLKIQIIAYLIIVIPCCIVMKVRIEEI